LKRADAVRLTKEIHQALHIGMAEHAVLLGAEPLDHHETIHLNWCY